MSDKDVILAVLQTGVSLAGLLLIFSGFLFSRAASFDSTARGDRYVFLGKLTLIPILMALAVSWMSLEALSGAIWAKDYLLTAMNVVVIATALAAILGVLTAA